MIRREQARPPAHRPAGRAGGRLRSDRVLYFLAPPGTGGRGRPARHGPEFALADPATWPGAQITTSTATSRYGTAVAAAWDRLHPRLTHRGAWLGHDGKLPIIEGTLIRLQVDHLPGDRDPKPVWLWSSRTRSAPGRDHGPTAGRVLPGVAARTCSSRRPAGGPGLSARPGTRAAGPATTGTRRPATTQPGRRVQVHPDALGPADERQLIQRGLINRKPGTQLQGQGMTGFAPWLQRQDLLRAPGTQHEARAGTGAGWFAFCPISLAASGRKPARLASEHTAAAPVYRPQRRSRTPSRRDNNVGGGTRGRDLRVGFRWRSPVPGQAAIARCGSPRSACVREAAGSTRRRRR
jgi:hypothetical protein